MLAKNDKAQKNSSNNEKYVFNLVFIVVVLLKNKQCGNV